MQDNNDKPKFRIGLLRYFSLVSLGGILAASVLLGMIFFNQARETMIQTGENRNVALARIISNSVWDQHSAFLAQASGLAIAELRQHPQMAALQRDVYDHIRNSSVIKIKIFDTTGKVLFSTDDKQIGAINTNSDNIAEALQGETVTVLTFRDSFHSNDAVLRNRNILSTYVPITKDVGEAGRPIRGLLEVYSDVTDLHLQLEHDRSYIILSVLGILFLLYLVLFMFVRKADRVIQNQIAQRRLDEERMRYLAYHDSLTGLPNRDLYFFKLQSAIEQAKRNERLVAILFMDLDRFKNINDNLGHMAGDELLKEVAKRLGVCVRKSDTIARQGGDEFTVLLECINHVDEVVQVCERIIELVNKPFEISGSRLFVSVSIGITIYPFDDIDVEGLLKDADAAMYAAKDSGRNKYVFYNSAMRVAGGSEQIELENRLRMALRENQYLLQYQPIVDARTGNLFGVEALLRWDNPEYGIVSPVKFVPLLEESGMMALVGEWVLNTACEKMVEWQQAGYAPFIMSVNVSMVQFRQMTFVDSVEQALARSGLEPQYLRLELTESMLMDQSDVSINKLQAIREMGVIIEIDDFGTGYSSLGYLKQLPIDVLKIDRSFITDVSKRSDGAAIVTAILAMAHSLKLEVIAEGVETIEELKYLSALRCRLIQGYFFSKPLYENDLLEVLKNPDFFIERLQAVQDKASGTTG